jgi:HK97 family phage portal protein
MTLLGPLLNLRDGNPAENPGRPLTDATLAEILGAGWRTTASVPVSEKNAVRLISVYRAVSLVSGVIAMLDLVAFREGSGRQPFSSRLLQRPHPDMTEMEVWERQIWQLLLNGNSYALKRRNRADAVEEIEPLPFGAVREVRRVTRSGANRWGKEFLVEEDGRQRVLTPWDVLHIPGPGYDGCRGLSPIGVAREGIGLALAQQEYAARLFGSGSLMSGVLQTEQILEEEDAKALKTRWQQRVGGLGKAHEVAVLDRGAKFQPIGINPEDAQFLESREFSVIEIARLYGIPPHLMSDVDKSTSWGTGIEQQTIALITFTLGPWMSRVEQRVSDECLPPGVRAEFRTQKLLRGDAKARAEANRVWTQSGVKSRNEARIEEGLPPVPGGDLMIVPANMTILDEAGMPLVVGAGGKRHGGHPPIPADTGG